MNMKALVFFVVALACTSAFKLQDRGSLVNNERIIGGEYAKHGEFPFQVGLALRNYLGSTWCGGALISNQWMLTAAHCTNTMQSATVYLGMTKQLFPTSTQFVYSTNFIQHKLFNPYNLVNDITLIKLSRVQLNSYIQPIALDNQLGTNYINKQGISSGWGRSTDANTNLSTDLKWGRLAIADISRCNSFFSQQMSQEIICASTENGVSTCHGDSGGPFVLQPEGTLIGLVSFGHSKSCASKYPVAFTKIVTYRSWIKQNSGL